MYLLLLDVPPIFILVGGTYLVEIEVTMPKCDEVPAGMVAETSSFLTTRRLDDANEEDLAIAAALVLAPLAVPTPALGGAEVDAGTGTAAD
jgi:hypothetical protein